MGPAYRLFGTKPRTTTGLDGSQETGLSLRTCGATAGVQNVGSLLTFECILVIRTRPLCFISLPYYKVSAIPNKNNLQSTSARAFEEVSNINHSRHLVYRQ